MSDREMIEETKKDVPDQMEPVIPEIPAEKSGKEPEVEAAESASTEPEVEAAEAAITEPESKAAEADSTEPEVEAAEAATKTWYVRGERAYLTHLLNFGHAKVNGGRVEGTHFLDFAKKQVVEEYLDAVKEALSGG